jgi:hypothetical protein
MIQILFFSLLFGSSALAQERESALVGRARDASGEALPGVVVTAEPFTGPDAFTSTTGAEGRYRMTVPTGRYRVFFRLAGYATHVAPEVVVSPGETRELDVVLHIALSTNVVVTGRSTFRNLASIDSSWDLFWGLGLDSELLYVGDAGTTEASRPSERLGFEWSLDALPKRWLTLDVSWAYSRAHFTDDDPAGNRIPSSIEGVATAGVAVTGLRG